MALAFVQYVPAGSTRQRYPTGCGGMIVFLKPLFARLHAERLAGQKRSRRLCYGSVRKQRRSQLAPYWRSTVATPLDDVSCVPIIIGCFLRSTSVGRGRAWRPDDSRGNSGHFASERDAETYGLTTFPVLSTAHDAGVQMIDTSIVRVHQHGACITGTSANPMGRSKGGLTSKIHALVDSNGLPARLALSP